MKEKYHAVEIESGKLYKAESIHDLYCQIFEAEGIDAVNGYKFTIDLNEQYYIFRGVMLEAIHAMSMLSEIID